MNNHLTGASWESLSQDQRDLYLRLLWAGGYSEKAIADFLGTTKGTIVGRRNRLKVSNEGRTALKGTVNPERFRDLLDLNRMATIEAESGGVVTCITPIGSEATCEWPLADADSLKELKLCGKPVKPGESFCEVHLEQLRRGRPR